MNKIIKQIDDNKVVHVREINNNNNFQNLIQQNSQFKTYVKQCEWFNEQKPASSDIEVGLINILCLESVLGLSST